MTYAVATCLIALALLVVLYKLLSTSSVIQFTLVAGLLIPSPYFRRPYLADAASVQDPLFVPGTTITLLAVVRVRPGLLLGGLLLAVAGRQSALLVGPIAGLWIVRHPSWRAGGRWRYAFAAAAVLVVPLALLALRNLTAPFTEDFQPHIPEDTVLSGWETFPLQRPTYSRTWHGPSSR